jgi:hypothetical protein
MEIVRHEVDPVGRSHTLLDVEMAEVPVGRRGRERENASSIKCGLELLEKQSEVLTVFGDPASVLGSWVLPVNIDTVEAVLHHESEDVPDEDLAVRRGGGHV